MAAKKRTIQTAATAQLTHNPFQGLGGAAPAGTQAAAQAAAGPAAKALRLDRKLVLRRELKGRGGKTVTRISGLLTGDLETLAPLLKKKLGCGALIEGADLVLLGDLVDRAAQWFAEQGATQIVKGN